MELKKMRDMTETELNVELSKMKKELFNLRFQHATGQLENPVKMRELKKDIARVKTIIREKELAAVQGLSLIHICHSVGHLKVLHVCCYFYIIGYFKLAGRYVKVFLQSRKCHADYDCTVTVIDYFSV